MPVTTRPEINVYFDGNGDGATASQISWENDDLMRGLRTMFNVKDDEIIRSITIDEVGIKASFSRKG